MEQDFACESCGCRYTSVGAAFFCPACRHNSAATTFDTAVQTVVKTISALPDIKLTVSKSLGADAAEETARLLIENSLDKLVSSFQRFAEATFSQLPNADQFAPRRNVFQNLGESSTLWREAFGKGYEDMLGPGEFQILYRYFQQRHLFTHKEGFVDQEYIERTDDRTYLVGQRLVLRETAVLSLANLVSELAKQLKQL